MSRTTSQLSIGQFRLHERLGAGGMGEVWRAGHPLWDELVALKLVTADRAQTPEFYRAFEREISAMSSLTHPGIVEIYDRGTHEDFDIGASGVDDGGLYLVMELADATLSAIQRPRLGWRHIRAILLSVLDALAHAHARGLVHRDLKPDNILFVPTERGLRLKIADFGMVQRFDEFDLTNPEVSHSSIQGTPTYMAPEQIEGRWRDQGPWTDLYALGCLAFWLTGGAPPFSGHTPKVLIAHTQKERPRLVSDVPVPEGFADWVDCLLSIEPERRFSFAADAARALLALEQLGQRVEATFWEECLEWETLFDEIITTCDDAERESGGRTVVSEMEQTEIISSGTLEARRRSEPVRSVSSGGGTAIEAELPQDWRRPAQADQWHQSTELGVGIVGQRQVPMVGRHAERDALWSALLDVHRNQRPRAVVIEGGPGIGKTRHASWTGRRAHELGGAEYLEAVHTDVDGPRDGLPRMIANHLRCTGLARGEILARVRDFTSRGDATSDDLYEATALAEFIAPAADPDYDPSDTAVQFGSPRERFDVVRRFFEQLTTTRPAYVLVDDVHLATDTPSFLHHLLSATERPLPVLFVLTARDGTDLARLRPLHNVEFLSLPPMADDEMHRLLTRHLPLEPRLAEVVTRRAAGNPLYAIQLADDWIERRIIEPTSEGFVLAADEVPEDIPESVRAVLVRRLEQALGHPLDRTSDRLYALEMAAALGQTVEQREWELLCLMEENAVAQDVSAALVDHDLARYDELGFRFTPTTTRDILEENARRHGRWSDVQRGCAAMLETLYPSGGGNLAARRTRHLLEAGDPGACRDLFHTAIEHFRATGDLERALDLCEHFETTLDDQHSPEDHPLRLVPWLGRIKIYSRRQRFEQMGELLEKAEPVAQTEGTTWDRAQVQFYRAVRPWISRDLERAIELSEDSLRLHEQTDDERATTWARIQVAEIVRNDGQYDRADELYSRALKTAAKLEDFMLMSLCHLGFGVIATVRGELDEARQQVERALKLRRKLGNLNAQITCILQLAMIDFRAGDLDAAETRMQEGLELCKRLDLDHHAMLTHVKIGVLEIARDQPHHAISHFEQALDEARRRDLDRQRTAIHLAMLHPFSVLEDWPAWQRHLEAATEHWAEPIPDAERLVDILDDAAAVCHDAGETERATTLEALQTMLERSSNPSPT